MNSKNSRISSEDFLTGQIIREPVGSGNGYWVGCPGIFYEPDEKAHYLTYRIRRPRGVAPDRGGEVRIARSVDLQRFEDVWTMTKDQVNSASIERSALCRGLDGQWRYFTSFVDPADGRWCVSSIKAGEVRKLNVGDMRRLFTAKDLKLEGVKDPWVFQVGEAYYMLLSVAISTATTRASSHSTLDIYNTGECLSATGLAASHDLDVWEWQGLIFAPEAIGWDCYCRRINSVLPCNGRYLAFYDGSASHLENYEEKCGLAVSTDLRKWQTLTPEGPFWTSPYSSGSIRYVDAQSIEGKIRIFYEFARADGAHDLRWIQCDAGQLPGV